MARAGADVGVDCATIHLMKYDQPTLSEHKDKIAQLKIGIVSAGLSHMGEREANHSKLVRRQADGARNALLEAGVNEENLVEIECPGVLEIPQMVRASIDAHKLDGVVAAALVVNGEIYRYEFVAQTSLDQLMNIPIDTGVPVASSLLTPAIPKSPETKFDFLLEHLYEKGNEAAGALLRQIIQLSKIRS